MEHTQALLKERDVLILRLERSETDKANVLGRIQTSIERLSTPKSQTASSAGSVAALGEGAAQLIRLDGQVPTSHALARRTRIGRVPGCELQIESSSVSRHHALIVMGECEVVIEDLNSTHGVLVNGRKVVRAALNDGDILTIGEAQFRFAQTSTLKHEAPATQ